MDTIEEIENLAAQCLETDYSNPQSVKEHNSAVNKIRELINNIKDEDVVIQLLNNKSSNSWVAFQCLEEPKNLSKEVYENAINVLKTISTKNSPEAMAAEMRLKELNVKS